MPSMAWQMAQGYFRWKRVRGGRESKNRKNLKLKGYPTVKCLSFAINFLLTKRLLPPPVLCFSISKTQSFPGSGSRQSDSNNFLIPLILRKTSSSKNFAAPKSQLHFLLGQVKRIISSRDISAHPITMGISMSGTFINSKRLKNVFLLLLM